jgi:PKD repeat protein
MKTKLLSYCSFCFALILSNHLFGQASSEGDTLIMCSSFQTNLASGVLFDSGGPNSNYLDQENCSFLIQPECAGTIMLELVNFETELGYDFLRIYDGEDEFSPIILNESGISDNLSLEGLSGSIFITWTSDISITRAGFELSWSTSLVTSDLITPLLSVSTSTASFNQPIVFSNITEDDYLATHWSFGDGDFATADEISHSFMSNGVFEVQMEVFVCDTSYSTSEFVTIFGAPEIQVIADTIDIVLDCGSESSITLDISNLGESSLQWELAEDDLSIPNLKILLLAWQNVGSPSYEAILAALEEHVPNYTLTISGSSNASSFIQQSVGKDIVLIPNYSEGSNSLFNNLAPVIQNYISSGGVVVHCHPTLNQATSLGLFSTAEVFIEVNRYYLAFNQLNPLLNGIPHPLFGQDLTRTYNITNTDYTSLLYPNRNGGNQRTVAGYREIGAGRAYLLGHDLIDSNSRFIELFGNIVNSARKPASISWLDIQTENGSIDIQEVATSQVNFSAEGLDAGEYLGSLILNSNDKDESIIEIPVRLTVEGLGQLSTLGQCADFGQIPVNSFETAGIWLLNEGCTAVNITAFNSLSNQFQAYNGPTVIAPADSIWVSLGGVVNEEGIVNTEIEVLSNLPPFTICLNANGVFSGGLVLNADTLYLDLDACDDIQSVNVLVTNYNLEAANINIDELPLLPNDVKIGVLLHGINTNQEWLNLQNALNLMEFENYELETTNSSTVSALSTFIQDQNVILLPRLANNNEDYVSILSPLLHEFVENGGKLIILAQTNGEIETHLNLGFFSVYDDDFTILESSWVNTEDPYASGIPSFIPGIFGGTPIAITDTDVQSIVAATLGFVACYRQIGQGKVFYYGFSTGGTNPNLNQILSNMIISPQTIYPGEIEITPAPLTIATGGNQILDIAISSINAMNGRYIIPLGFQIEGESFYSDTVIVVVDITGGACSRFSYSSSCPSTVSFINTSYNEITSILWDFGDGVTSTDYSPIHVFDANGLYDVSLTVCDNNGCNTSTQTIEVSQQNNLIPPSCTTNNITALPNYGISHVELGSISNYSLTGIEDYKDYSCNLSTEEIIGDNIPFTIETYNMEYVKIWLDSNNDGIFSDETELLYQSASPALLHSSYINIPLNSVLNTPLRIRITSDKFIISDACSNPINGQTEDYAVVVIPSAMAPVADFSALPLVGLVGETIHFTNQTSGGATSYTWFFESSNEPMSTDVNPQITYNEVGIYDVTLIATNQFGSDTVVKPNFITILNTVNMCSNTLSTNMTSGFLYDSGGPLGNYDMTESCSFLIAPECADSIILSIDSFDTQWCCSFLRVYDGTNANGQMISPPAGVAGPITLIASSGSVFITWSTNSFNTSPGFSMSWNSVLLSNEEFNADFTMSNFNPALYEEIVFTDLSVGHSRQWHWDFGDGFTSFLPNPRHSYTEPGSYEVVMISNNCFSSDTISYTVVVQEVPEFVAVQLQTNYIEGCFNEGPSPILLSNDGGGALNWSLEPIIDGDNQIQILMLTYGAGQLSQTQQIINILNESDLNFTLTQYQESDPIFIESIIESYDVVILPRGNGIFSFYNAIGSILLSFVESGGTVIKAGIDNSFELDNTGFFESSNENAISVGELIVNTNNKITEDFPSVIPASLYTSYVNVQNDDFISLITFNNRDVVGYRDVGQGRAYYIGFDYTSSNPFASLLLTKIIKVNSNNNEVLLPEWLSIEDTEGLVTSGEISELNFNVNTTGLESGVYSFKLPIFFNDVNHLSDSIEFNLFIDVSPCPSYSITNACNGSTTFYNTSTNYNSLAWTIEGLGTYNDEFVEVSFPAEGVYQIILEACNSFICVRDTQMVSIIQSSPIEMLACVPSAPDICCISSLNSIQTSSGIYNNSFLVGSQIHYTDLSCSDIIYLQESSTSQLQMQLNQSSFYVVYIDYDNNGSFSSNEMIASGFGDFINSEFIVPSNTSSGVPIRMRILIDNDGEISDECETAEGGAIYDYAVITIDNTLLPSPLFDIQSIPCSGQKVFLNSSVNATSFIWDFGDGNSSTEANPVHIYTTSGNYQVTLFAYNEWGVSELVQMVQVEVITDAISYFGIAYNSMPIQFFLSGSYESYEWLAYDGQTSNLPSPTFIFTDQFVFLSVTVTLNGCEYTFTNEAEPFVLGVNDGYSKIETSLYPNPTNNFAYLELSNYTGEKPVVDLLDVTGRLIGPCRKISEGEGALKYLIEPSVNGVYLIRISSGDSNKTLRLVVSK